MVGTDAHTVIHSLTQTYQVNPGFTVWISWFSDSFLWINKSSLRTHWNAHTVLHTIQRRPLTSYISFPCCTTYLLPSLCLIFKPSGSYLC